MYTISKFKHSLQNQTIVIPPSSNLPSNSSSTSTPVGGGNDVPIKHKSNTGTVVGGIVGGIVALAIAALAVVWFRRQRSRGAFFEETAAFAQPEPFVYGSVPMQTTIEGTAPVGPHTTAAFGGKRAIYTDNASPTTSANTPTTSTSAFSPLPGPTSSHQTPSSDPDPIISPTEVRDLRVEMENLRRAMQGIGVESAEPPPTYE